MGEFVDVGPGADPRSSGPSLDYDGGLDDSDDSEDLTALAAAANAKNPHILRRLKPDKERDDIDKLLVEAATFGREDTVRYLLQLGANPNDKPNGGSAALDGCLSKSLRCESFRWEISPHWYVSSSKASKYSVSKTLQTVELLLEHGALLRPDNDKEARASTEPGVELEGT